MESQDVPAQWANAKRPGHPRGRRAKLINREKRPRRPEAPAGTTACAAIYLRPKVAERNIPPKIVAMRPASVTGRAATVPSRFQIESTTIDMK